MRQRSLTLRGPLRPLEGWRANLVNDLRHALGPSGGLSYHLSALRHRHRWAVFQAEVERWLNAWAPRERKLLIFGPSAGWSLPRSFFERFDSVVVVEPDPLARHFLRYRFDPEHKWQMINNPDLLPWLSDSPRKFASFIDEFPGHAILFSNLLGQIPLLWRRPLPPEEWREKNEEFLLALKGRTWASYHDVLSAHCRPALSEAEITRLQPDLNRVSLARGVWGEDDHRTIIDHGTEWLPTSDLALWPLRARTFHLIGFYGTRAEPIET